jgi:BirA family transcriptional regulator, biotin operon repressor / biotin---[acetyl-CoA-carboxylase] ligase
VTHITTIKYLEAVRSTNEYLADGDFPDTTIVYSFNQTSGKGRENRQWIDCRDKSLALSITSRSMDGIAPLWQISLLSIPLVELLKTLDVSDCWIKWPNDIFVRDKKIAGVLAESVLVDGKLERIIAGIGINVNVTADDLKNVPAKASSLLLETGIEYDISEFAQKYIGNIQNSLVRFENMQSIRKTWIELSNCLGARIEWMSMKGILNGTVLDVDHDGVLHIETNNGIEKIHAGDIHVLSYK